MAEGGTDVVLLSSRDVAAMLGIDSKTVERLGRRGDLPRPISIGPRIKKWNKDSILRWLAEQTK